MKESRPLIDVAKANATRLTSARYLPSPGSGPMSNAFSSPSAHARSLTHTDTGQQADSVSTLGGIELMAFPQRRGVTGFPASASSSFLPVLADTTEEKKEASDEAAAAVTAAGPAAAGGAAAAQEDSDSEQQRHTTTAASPAFSPPAPALSAVPSSLSSDVDLSAAVLGGLSLLDLSVLLRNRSMSDDDVQALHDEDYLHRLPPALLPPCSDRDISISLPREAVIKLQQRMDAQAGVGDGRAELYPVIVQLRPIDESGLPKGRGGGGGAAGRLEEKERACGLYEAEKPSASSPQQPQQRGLEQLLANDPNQSMLVAELTVMDCHRHATRTDADTGRLASPRALLAALSPRDSSPTPSGRSLSLSPAAAAEGESAALPSSSLDHFLTHIRFCRQLLVTPAHSVYEMEELFGLEAEARDCIVCLSERKDIVLLPCRHVAVCHACHRNVTKCPVCRSAILNYCKWVEPDGVAHEMAGDGGRLAARQQGGGGGGAGRGGGGAALLPAAQPARDGQEAKSPSSGLQLEVTAGKDERAVELQQLDAERGVEEDERQRREAAEADEQGGGVEMAVLGKEEKEEEANAAALLLLSEERRALPLLVDVEAEHKEGTRAAPNTPASLQR